MFVFTYVLLSLILYYFAFFSIRKATIIEFKHIWGPKNMSYQSMHNFLFGKISHKPNLIYCCVFFFFVFCNFLNKESSY